MAFGQAALEPSPFELLQESPQLNHQPMFPRTQSRRGSPGSPVVKADVLMESPRTTAKKKKSTIKAPTVMYPPRSGRASRAKEQFHM